MENFERGLPADFHFHVLKKRKDKSSLSALIIMDEDFDRKFCQNNCNLQNTPLIDGTIIRGICGVNQVAPVLPQNSDIIKNAKDNALVLKYRGANANCWIQEISLRIQQRLLKSDLISQRICDSKKYLNSAVVNDILLLTSRLLLKVLLHASMSDSIEFIQAQIEKMIDLKYLEYVLDLDYSGLSPCGDWFLYID